MGNSMGRAPLGRSDTEATRGWTERKPWEIAWGHAWWTEGKPWEIALGRAALGGSETRGK